MSGKQTPFPLLRLGLKFSFLIKLIVRDGSDDPETSYAIWHYCGHQLVFPCSNMYPLNGVTVFVVPSFLSSQTPAGPGRWPPFLSLELTLYELTGLF